MDHDLRAAGIQAQVERYLREYEQEELWKILEIEWTKAQAQVAPKRSFSATRPQLEKFVAELKQRIELNQALLPSSATAMTSYLISQIEPAYPWITQFKIPLSILVAILIQSLQSTWLSSGRQTSSGSDS